MKKTTVLVIADGLGLSAAAQGNAVLAANTPNLIALNGGKPLSDCTSKLQASGSAVGLPDGTMGNSEVGHTNMGAGSVVYQSLLRISNAIDDGSFGAMMRENGGVAPEEIKRVHLFALLGDAGVHSAAKHLMACVQLLESVPEVYLHLFTDGRDSAPTSAIDYVRELQTRIGANVKIATLIGRFYAMDRDKRWDRVEIAYNSLVNGAGVLNSDPVAALQESYASGKTDEFVEPIITCPNSRIRQCDSVIFVNYRPDRARELTRAFVDPNFSGFSRTYFPVKFVCMTQYDDTMPNVSVAFPPIIPKDTFGEVVSKLGLKQLRIAETEKYAHVTFFFNGGVEEPFEGEDRILIPSPKEFATYDLIPEMSAYKVCDSLCERIRSGAYDVIICNFANCDMVGHTGSITAAIKAVETVDECVGRVISSIQEVGGNLIITADHGNAEQMLASDGVTVHTAHTTNLVPVWIFKDGKHICNIAGLGRLCDIAPTLLDLMGYEIPKEWNGQSLVLENQNND